MLTYALDNTAPATEALSDGEAASDGFTVAALGIESQERSTYVATFSITGTNDAAVITGDIDGTVIEAGGGANAETNTAQVSGNLDSSDVDHPNDPIPNHDNRPQLWQRLHVIGWGVDLHPQQQQRRG